MIFYQASIICRFVKNCFSLQVASNLVEPSKISVSWNDIAGLESVIEELRETVILPIKERELFATSNLTKAPRGVLLHVSLLCTNWKGTNLLFLVFFVHIDNCEAGEHKRRAWFLMAIRKWFSCHRHFNQTNVIFAVLLTESGTRLVWNWSEINWSVEIRD